MGRYSEVKELEHRVRSSLAYHRWVERNRSHACLSCDCTDGLEVHHVVDLYHVLLGLWKLYGDRDAVFTHANAMHDDDRCEAVTLCGKCHDKLHPGMSVVKSNEPVQREDWTVMPRNLPAPLLHGSKSTGPGLSLIGVQTLAGIGWHILAGRLESRMVEFNRRDMARLLGKTPGTSFNHSLDNALAALKACNVLLAYAGDTEVEVHLAKPYLESLASPWFLPMTDVRTSRMVTFALRWAMSHQSGRRTFKIGRDKLVARLGLETATPGFLSGCIKQSCEETGWLSCSYDGRLFTFRLRRRGSVPIFSLRSLLADTISQGG